MAVVGGVGWLQLGNTSRMENDMTGRKRGPRKQFRTQPLICRLTEKAWLQIEQIEDAEDRQLSAVVRELLDLGLKAKMAQ